MSDDSFLEDLRAQLLDSADRASTGRHRARVPMLAGAAVLLVVALSLVVAIGGHDGAAADVEVSVEGSDFVVRLTDLETSPDRIVSRAEEAGLDLRVREVPVGPSNVGKFVGTTIDRPADFRPIDPSGGAFTGFRVSRDWPGTLVVEIGRPAEEGELWSAASDALAPGEALACRRLLGLTVDQVRRRLAGSDLEVRWFMMPSPAEVADPAPYGQWRVIEVEGLSPGSVAVMASEDGSWPFLTPRPTLPADC